jgi:hypothetical protein
VADADLVFVRETDGGLELVVNFGVFAGRQATPAEVDRLADALLEDADALTIVCEERYNVDRERRANVYQVRVEVPRDSGAARDRLLVTSELWARDCIAERRLITP